MTRHSDVLLELAKLIALSSTIGTSQVAYENPALSWEPSKESSCAVRWLMVGRHLVARAASWRDAKARATGRCSRAGRSAWRRRSLGSSRGACWCTTRPAMESSFTGCAPCLLPTPAIQSLTMLAFKYLTGADKRVLRDVQHGVRCDERKTNARQAARRAQDKRKTSGAASGAEGDIASSACHRHRRPPPPPLSPPRPLLPRPRPHHVPRPRRCHRCCHASSISEKQSARDATVQVGILV